MAANEAIMRSGDPIFVDYTAAATLLGGQVVLIGNTAGLTCGVTHNPIANAALGAIAVGGGVYDCVVLANAALGAKMYWDDTNNKLTTTSTNNALFGFLVEACVGANTTCQCLHKPYS